MKKKELWLIVGILLFSLILWAAMTALRRGDYGYIRISVDGREYGVYSLAEDQVISIGSTNVCEIRNGKVKMVEADCPDHLCMRQPAIGKGGGTIVCLPNKVVIEGVKNADSENTFSEFDTVV